MILRKPYAILIKHFKLLHAILAALMLFLFYRTNLIASFINDYISSAQLIVKTEEIESLFGPIIFIVVVFITIFSVIVMAVLSLKKKPVKFYIYNIITYIYTLIMYSVANYLVQQMHHGLIDIKTLKLIGDLTEAAMIFQIVALLIVIVRATGFDIKDFNFKEDLAALEIEESDNEEFEVSLDVDTDKLARKTRKKLRYAKYIYVENMFFINTILIVFIAGSAIFVATHINVYSQVYEKNESFKTVEFIMGTGDSFITKTDLQGKVIKDGYEFVVVRLNLKRLSNRAIPFNTGRLVLHANGHGYVHNTDYFNEMADLGISYSGQNIPNKEFKPYIMVYEVPESDIKGEIYLHYTDTTGDIVKIKVNPIDLNKVSKETNVAIGQELKLNKSVFKNTVIKIDKMELGDSFKVEYQYCLEDNCSDSVEYVNVGATDNYNKTLMKLTGNLELDTTLPINKISSGTSSLYKLINTYGTIVYTKDGETREIRVKMREIKPRQTKVEGIYFIEVSRSLMSADEISLRLNIRNKIYEYKVK